MTLQELIARKSELLAELTQVEAAIAAAGDSSPVRIRTWKNIRNTVGVATHPDDVKEWGDLMVFSDESLSHPADNSSHEGWVVKEEWERFKLQNPGMLEGLDIEEIE